MLYFFKKLGEKMLYLILLISTLASTGKTVFMKKIGVGSSSFVHLFLQNALSFWVAALVTLAILRFDILKIFNISLFSLVMSFLFALSVILTYVSQTKAMALGNSSSTMLIYSCGFLIPVIFGVIRYGEGVSLLQFSGLLVLAPAIFMIINPKREGSFSVLWIVLSVLAMSGSGITAVLQKIHQRSVYSEEFLSLLTLEFIFAAVILSVITLLMSRGVKPPELPSKAVGVSVTNGFFIGILNILNLRLAGKLPAVVVFPIYNIGSLVLSGIILTLMFKEKTSAKEKTGLVLGILGILLIGIG